MMKSYKEKTKPDVQWDWVQYLNMEAGKVTSELARQACTLSVEWTTCACGDQCSVIPRYPLTDKDHTLRGAPKDGELRKLGIEFNILIFDIRIAVNKLNFDTLRYYQEKALSTLEKIEARSFELIMEITLKA